MVLRIEDTDIERSQARYEDQLIADLKWLGLDWDEGTDVGGPYVPYRQSDRLDIYKEHADRLLHEHKAYLCFCTEEDLQKERDRVEAEHGQALYSGKCRAIDPGEAQSRRAAGEACAIRLRIPEHPIRFHDIVHGEVEFSNEVVSDPIIVRSSGMPVYNYVVVVDDGLMKITHVIRGDDHLSNTPKQVALYEALGWPVPEFAHLSTILGADRERLSKRHGATSIANFREMGVLPEALVNYLALLGWAPTGGTREIFSTRRTGKGIFSGTSHAFACGVRHGKAVLAESALHQSKPLAERINKLALRILRSMRSLRKLPAGSDRLTQLFAPYVDRLDQLPEKAKPIFEYDAKAALTDPDNAEVLALPNTDAVFARFTVKVLEDESAQAGQLAPEHFKQMVNEVKAETGAKGKELFHPIRLMITGSHSGPDFDKVIPIIEEGSHLDLPKHVLSVRERVEAFVKAKSEAR